MTIVIILKAMVMKWLCDNNDSDSLVVLNK